ncbi:AraC family transcriptional regulator [Acinetobacter populi]|uniref:AraC family transcriptional regulator n=1 Tax=Acinetobacter populi TaxID=1582270 RepID=A0A1Z9Z1W7_9GAMM|nr:AraC family transcriptional regulator [Acinetobacter populi]OUY08445.1 AraC family transcriptional regulator [Acinetobacter populi]
MSTLKYSDFKVHPVFPEVVTSQVQNLSLECAPHFHLGYDFTLITSGLLELKHNNSISYFNRDQLCIINPGNVHYGKGIGKEPLSIKNIRISQNFMHEIIITQEKHRLIPLIFPQCAIFDQNVIHLFKTYFDVARQAQKPPQDVLDAGWKLFYALIEFADEMVLLGNERNQLLKSIEIMQQAVDKTIKISDIAQAVHLSEYHFIKKFKQIFGLTPYSYFMQMKLESAFYTLIQGKKIQDVANQYGYADQAHFNRLIKQHYGYTPLAVKKIKSV